MKRAVAILDLSIKFLLFIIIFSFSLISNSQVLSPSRAVDWSLAGIRTTYPIYMRTVNAKDYGASPESSATVNNNALTNALSSLEKRAGVIMFPSGIYNFNKSFYLPDSVVLKGESAQSTKLIFDLGKRDESIFNVTGKLFKTHVKLTKPALIGSSVIIVENSSSFFKNDFIKISLNDSSLVFSSWALRTVGQIVQVSRINGDSIFLKSPLRFDYPLSLNPYVDWITPAKYTGIECLKIERTDTTITQTSNINFEYAANCWVSGVESYNANFAHININSSSNIMVSGCYIHHAFQYGGNGQGYGVMLQSTSNECLIENNIFNHLRHSMIIQSGANANVLSYNYSIDPYWTESSLPSNSAGDITIHGNYSYANLLEGNIVQNIVIDASHGINGPYNTFFRNRAELFGLVMANNPASNSQNFIGNEITNTGFPKGLYILYGSGHFEYGNNIKGTIKPTQTSTLPDKSLYLTSAPSFWNAAYSWPDIGTPYAYNLGSISSKDNYTNSIFTTCNIRYKISGKVNYDNSKQTALSNIMVYLHNGSGSKIDSAITDSQGALLFNNVINGNYRLSAGTTLNWRKSTPTDALMISKAFVKLYTIKTPLQFIAADVTNDNNVNATDALLISKRFVSLISSFRIPDWLFEKRSFSISDTDMIIDLKGICAGDITGAY